MSSKNNSQTVQQKMSKLSELVAWFDGDDFQLEKAFDAFKQAEALAVEIETDLEGLQNEIEVLKKKFDNTN